MQKRFHGFLKQVGQNIRELRANAGWTQVETSRRADIPERRYQEIEAGKANITLRSVFRLAAAFKKSPAQIL